MLKTLFRKIAEPPQRYITVDGDIYGTSILKGAHYTTPFKAAASSIAIMAAIFSKIDPSVSAMYAAGGVAGYLVAEMTYGNYMRWQAKNAFKRAAIVDMAPIVPTAPKDLASAAKLRADDTGLTVGLGLSYTFTAAACVTVMGGLLAFIPPNATKELLKPDFYQTVGLLGIIATGLTNVTSRLVSRFNRMGRVLNGEYSILDNPPARQQMREREYSLSASPPQLQPKLVPVKR